MNLSGGMDSSSLLWASKNSDKNISALTTKFSDAQMNIMKKLN